MELLQTAFIISLGINTLMFVPAYIFKTDKLTDISYSITFIAVALVTYFKTDMSLLHYLLFAVIFIWAVRLGGYLFIRINEMKKDKRFDNIRNNFFAFLRFWLLQGITVFIVLLPLLLVYTKQNPILAGLSMTGLVLAVSGIVIESVADKQKYTFKKQVKNKKKWIDSGLWSVSRHPNYLGEILMWAGVYVAAIPVLSSTEMLVGALSPLFITALLLFGSGIPALEKSAQAKWGNNKDYQKYKSEVPVLLPSINSIKRQG